MKMNKSTVTKLALFVLAICFLISLSFYGLLYSQSFKMFTDGLDGFGGRASSANFSERISSGGQPGVIGTSQGASFHGLQGYVNTAAFEHGDCDGDGTVGLADAVYLINYTLKGGPEPIPLETGDMDCPNNYVDLADVVYLINYLFQGGAPPCNL
jgi:hypothetical protein